MTRNARSRLLALGLASVSVLSLAIGAGAGSSPTLSARVQERSRGNNLGNALKLTDCDEKHKNDPCIRVDLVCTTCAIANFATVTGSGAGYDFDIFGEGSCGKNKSGICDENLKCETSKGNDVGTCTAPPAPPTNQL